MAYLDVITLATAKNYLGVDTSMTEDDADITKMIKGALRYVEEFTNVLVYARDKDYLFQDCEVRVYDHPIKCTCSLACLACLACLPCLPASWPASQPASEPASQPARQPAPPVLPALPPVLAR